MFFICLKLTAQKESKYFENYIMLIKFEVLMVFFEQEPNKKFIRIVGDFLHESSVGVAN